MRNVPFLLSGAPTIENVSAGTLGQVQIAPPLPLSSFLVFKAHERVYGSSHTFRDAPPQTSGRAGRKWLCKAAQIVLDRLFRDSTVRAVAVGTKRSPSGGRADRFSVCNSGGTVGLADALGLTGSRRRLHWKRRTILLPGESSFVTAVIVCPPAVGSRN